MTLRKAGSNWVEGDRFFDREAEIRILTERVRERTHTLLTAQRRMGKTSLVRETLRRLGEEGCFETIFVDLESAITPADAIAEIVLQSRSARGIWQRLKSWFANVPDTVGSRIDTLGVPFLRLKLRAGIDAGNWRQKGDQVFATLAENDRPVVLAIDELPILVNRLLKGDGDLTTPERRQEAEIFLSWLRKNGQEHQGRVCMILSGSVGLGPILRHAGLSAQANIYSPFDLKPWDEQTAVACLGTLAETYGLDLSLAVRRDMCHRLRCQVPHHVQLFFDNLHEDLRQLGRSEASLEDVDRVYTGAMLGAGREMVLKHYESRLKMVLGKEGYRIAVDLLTEAAVNCGRLSDDAIGRYRRYFLVKISTSSQDEVGIVAMEEVLHVLEHDGYLARDGEDGYRFMSGLLEDWWRGRHSQSFVPIGQRRV